MHKKISHLAVSLLVMVIAMMPSVAKADFAYTFVKMTCDPETKTAELKAFWDWNESGRKMTESPEKDVYPLGERTGNPSETKGKCSFGDGNEVSFTAYQYGLPKHDSLKLFLNGHEINEHYTLNDQWTMHIQSTAPQSYDLTFCPDDPGRLHTLSHDERQELRAEQKTKCELMSVHRNNLIVDYHAIDPEAEK